MAGRRAPLAGSTAPSRLSPLCPETGGRRPAPELGRVSQGWSPSVCWAPTSVIGAMSWNSDVPPAWKAEVWEAEPLTQL